MPTQAASELPICASESAMLFAAQDILVKVCGFAAASVRLDGDFERLPDECCIVKFTDFGTFGRENEYSGGPGWPVDTAGAPATEYTRGTGQLSISYRLPKTDNVESAILGLHRVIDERSAKIRSAFFKHNQNFNTGRLPYHIVTDIMRQAPQRGVDTAGERECQVVVENFLVTYEINPDAWPAMPGF